MAGAGWRQWTRETLGISLLQTFLQDQVVAVFATNSARDAAITAPAEGMVCYVAATDRLLFYNGTAWRPVGDKMTVVNRAERLALGGYAGLRVYETSTQCEWMHDGTTWVLLAYLGTATTIAAGRPAAAAVWTNAVIAANTPTNFSGWTTTTLPPAGDLDQLFTAPGVAGSTFRTNVRGRAKLSLYAVSDSGVAGRSTVLMGTPTRSGYGGFADTRQRATGYTGAGTLEQSVKEPFDAQVNDVFGCAITQGNTANAAVTYGTVMQVVELGVI